MADWRFGRSFSPPRLSARPRSRRCWAGPRLKHHLVALLLILAVGDASKAAVDLTGDWNMALLDMDAFLVPIVQTGSSLQVGGIPGTIDASTGSFQFGPIFNPFEVCPWFVRADAAPDGTTFTGTVYGYNPAPGCGSPTCACWVESARGPFSGSRSPCGDGIVDPGETCDDGNLGRNGDCCALGCSLQPAGQACTSDGSLCTSDVCDGAGTCTHPAANAGIVCRPAADLCDVAESCDGVQSDCPADGKQPNGTDCSDGQFCNGAETTCEGGACQNGAAPCALLCDEVHDECVTGCPAAPQSCRTAKKSLLLVKNESDDGEDELIWRLTRGAPTSQTDFADPTGSADYAFCVFAGTASALVGKAVIPASATLWSSQTSRGYRYKDPAAAVDGIEKIVLRGSTRNTTRVRVIGKGTELADLPLPVTAPLIVQLANGDNGICWGVSYSAAQLLENEPGRLKAKAP